MSCENFSRRMFLRSASLGALALLLTSCDIAQTQEDEQQTNAISEITKKQFGIERINTVNSYTVLEESNIRCEPFTYGFGSGTQAMETIYQELCKYSPAFFRKTESINWGITLCKNIERLEADGKWKSWGGLMMHEPSGFRALISYESNTSLIRHLHHEMFHGFKALVLQIATNPFLTDISGSLQNINSKYQLETGNGFDCHQALPTGYARCYSELSVEEDGATIAEDLFANGAQLFERARDDKALFEKILLIQDFYETISDGEMNETFFAQLSLGQNTGFWNWPTLPQNLS